MNRPGALAEQLVVPSDNAWAIPGQAARDLACVEPLAVVEAALRRMGDPPIGTALVIGVGSQGLLATLSLVARGTAVLVHDVNPARVALAISLGARALDPDDAAVSVDLVVDTVGTSAAVDVALRHLAIGGTLLVLALDATPFELTAQTIVRRQLVIRGSLTYDHPGDFACHGRTRPDRERSRRAGSSPTSTPWTRRRRRSSGAAPPAARRGSGSPDQCSAEASAACAAATAARRPSR